MFDWQPSLTQAICFAKGVFRSYGFTRIATRKGGLKCKKMQVIEEKFTIDINFNGDLNEVINDLIKRKLEGDIFVKILLASNDPVYEFECWENVLSRPEFTEWVTIHKKEVAHGFKGCFIQLKIPNKYKTVMYTLGVEFTKEFAKGNIKKLASRLAFALKEKNKLNGEQTDLIEKFIIDNLQLFL